MRNYREYYDAAREIYHQHNPDAVSDGGVYCLTVCEIRAGRPNPFLKLPTEYAELIRSLSDRVSARIDGGDGVLCDAQDPGRGFTQKLGRIWDLPEIDDLGRILIPQLEENLFGSYVCISAVHIYRSLVTDRAPASSWLWHYDNNPLEVIKMLIYLSDCDADTGAFEYLRDPGTGGGVKIESSRTGFEHWTKPVFEGSRIPQTVIEDYIQRGYEPVRVTGQAGVGILFDNNCVHRATAPKRCYRDAMVLLLRPVDRPIRPFISRAHTGSWLHREPVADPDILTPIRKDARAESGGMA